jgi:hypothetical protein
MLGMTAQEQEQQQAQEKNEVNNPTLDSQRSRVEGGAPAEKGKMRAETTAAESGHNKARR